MPVLASTLVLWPGSPAAARHNFSMLMVQPQLAAPGTDVTVSGFSYTKTAVVRFGAVDGPELARLEPTSNNDISGTVRIPPGTPAGRYVLFAMHQDERGKPTRFPGRAAILVAGPGGAPLVAPTGLELEVRPDAPLERDAVPLSQVALVGVATVGVGAFVAGIVLVGLSRRRRPPQPVAS
ncbi:MAG: hypothetical protein ACRD12_03270 [Acidimicrobiales bacterium]